jgi:ABC-type Fe3+/spermidine/putrescine transport system ATPase subunit
LEGLVLANIQKSFDGKKAVADVSLQVRRGEILALLGPSGCGKSTLLSITAGLLEPDSGQVLWNGADMQHIPAYKRRFGLMFQDLALFPHLSVERNIAFGLEMKGWSKEQIQHRIHDMLQLVNLPAERIRDVSTLSGGEKQRIALARTLAPMPELLMLDEPLGAADRTLRENLLMDLSTILDQLDQTVIYVTHDQEEAFAIADRIVIMEAGWIRQAGTPREVYQHPASIFVARFLGLNNLIQARPSNDPGEIHTDLGRIPYTEKLTEPSVILLRPDAVRIGQGAHTLQGVLTSCSFRGSICRSTIQVGSQQLVFDFPMQTELPQPGAPIQISFDPEEAIQVFHER